MSSKFFSWRRIEAPSVIILKATLSSSLPSFIRCAFKISTRGFPSLSNTSLAVSRWLGGNGTAERGKKHNKYLISFTVKSLLLIMMHFKRHLCCKTALAWVFNCLLICGFSRTQIKDTINVHVFCRLHYSCMQEQLIRAHKNWEEDLGHINRYPKRHGNTGEKRNGA